MPPAAARRALRQRLPPPAPPQVFDTFPTVTIDISLRALGFWSFWLFIIPSLRARRPRGGGFIVGIDGNAHPDIGPFAIAHRAGKDAAIAIEETDQSQHLCPYRDARKLFGNARPRDIGGQPGASGGQLDRQGETVQFSDDCGHVLGILRSDFEARGNRPGPVDEQLDRRQSRDALGIGVPDLGDLEGGQEHLLFSLHSECGPTGDQEAQFRRGTDEILPAFAYVSEIIPVFSRKVIFGYPLMVAATVSIGFISLGVWVHHMFAVGLSPAVNTAFMASTMLIAVPTGIKMFNWVATMFGGQIRLHTPMLFSIGFLSQFLFGGLTGIMLAVVPFDWQVSDSYFVVGHFHYVLFGGLVFTIFAAIYYWFPKVSGRMLSETLGKWHFWLLFIGFNLTFAPMHVSGMLGMPRRIYTYQLERGWEFWNLLSSIGVLFQALAIAFFVWNIIRSLRRGKPAGDDPWDAWTLEWTTTSPPPPWNYDVAPEVRSRRPLWDMKHPEDPDWKYE